MARKLGQGSMNALCGADFNPCGAQWGSPLQAHGSRAGLPHSVSRPVASGQRILRRHFREKDNQGSHLGPNHRHLHTSYGLQRLPWSTDRHEDGVPEWPRKYTSTRRPVLSGLPAVPDTMNSETPSLDPAGLVLGEMLRVLESPEASTSDKYRILRDQIMRLPADGKTVGRALRRACDFLAVMILNLLRRCRAN